MLHTTLFADPAWDMLLALFASSAEGRRVSASSACIASDVATSTALRWVSELEDAGFVIRRPDPADGRRTFPEIQLRASEAVERWLNATFA